MMPFQLLENLVTDTHTEDLKLTPLNALHRELGGKMVPFAGYEMAVQYEGVLAEHLHTREQAGLFDVSHMGQATLEGDDPHGDFETMVAGDIKGLGVGRIRYTQFTNDAGGIYDDLMVTNRGDHLFMVVNAACKDADFALIKEKLGGRCTLDVITDRALVALQGPAAATVLARFDASCADMPFMSGKALDLDGAACWASRSGYTGEDGYEISIPEDQAERLVRLLLDQAEVKPIGLGARDSLRLEAGLCLYGSDIDETTSQVEGTILWSVSKRRRTEGGFPGAAVLQRHIAEGVTRKRVGMRPDGKAPARPHTVVTDTDGNPIGEVTSGGYGPSVGGPIAVGYLKPEFAAPGTPINFVVRGKSLPGKVVSMPFAPHRYFRK